jgi:hypothetical protein
LSNDAVVVEANLTPVLEVSADLRVSYLGNAHIRAKERI